MAKSQEFCGRPGKRTARMLARLPERCFHEWLSQKLRPAAASNARKIRRRNPSLEHPRVLKPLWQERDSRSEEHTSELQSLIRISYAVFCLKKKKQKTNTTIVKNKTIN